MDYSFFLFLPPSHCASIFFSTHEARVFFFTTRLLAGTHTHGTHTSAWGFYGVGNFFFFFVSREFDVCVVCLCVDVYVRERVWGTITIVTLVGVHSLDRQCSAAAAVPVGKAPPFSRRLCGMGRDSSWFSSFFSSFLFDQSQVASFQKKILHKQTHTSFY